MKAVYFDPHLNPAGFLKAKGEFPELDFVVAPDEDALARALPGAEILVTSNRIYTESPAAVIRTHGTGLKWLQFVTSGIDKAVRNGLPQGVVVTNVAGLRAFCVSEHAFALMLGLVRRLSECDRARDREFWTRDETNPRFDNLAGKHLVIVGCGAIGQDIARKAKAFDMRVTGISRARAPLANFDAMRPRDELVAAARDADMLMIAALAGEDTDGMISRQVIAAMKSSAFVVNIARGSLIEEAALVEALRQRRIAGAGLDVMEEEPLPPGHPLWHLDNVVLTPHVAGAGSAGLGASHASIFFDNFRRWRAGQPLEKIVIERT